MRTTFFSVAIAAALAVAGCTSFEHSNTATSPTAANGASTGISGLMGTWTSASTNPIPSPSSCTNFKWMPTEMTATSGKGAFSATCAGGLNVSGTAQGTLSGTTINWSADAISSTPDIASCAVHLTGTAELGVDSIRIPYSGTTCLGAVSGVEILARH